MRRNKTDLAMIITTAELSARVTLGYNMAWTMVEFGAAFAGWRMLNYGLCATDRQRYICIGLIISGLSVGAHRLWWNVWRYAQIVGDNATAQWISDHGWIPGLLVIGVLIGSAWFFRPALEVLFGQVWALSYFALLSLVFCFGLFLPEIVSTICGACIST